MKKIRWGIIGGACAILVFYLTIAFVASWMILDRIAAQTSHSASPFGTWWQILIFVIDIAAALGVAGGGVVLLDVPGLKGGAVGLQPLSGLLAGGAFGVFDK